MINIARGVYRSSLPVPLVEEINILPSSPTPGISGTFSMVVNVALQSINNSDTEPVSLFVAAFKDMNYLKAIKSNDAYLRRLITGPSADETQVITKIVSISPASKGQNLSVFNEKERILVKSKNIEIPFDIVVDGATGGLRNLAVLVVAYRDLAPEDDSLAWKLDVGKTTVERVLFEGKIPATTNVFKLTQDMKEYGSVGEVWTGPVHLTRKALMAGNKHLPEDHPTLERHIIINQKIKDIRPIQRLYKHINRLQAPPPGIQNYFGTPLYSRSANNSVKIYIPFNFAGYVIENSEFSNIIRNRATLLSTAAVLDIKVFRRRVSFIEEGNRLTTDKVTSDHPDDTNVLADCGTPATLIGTLRTGDVRLLSIPGLENVYNIFINDKYMADSKQSYYEYSLEVDLVDKSGLAINNIRARLIKRLYQYQSYLFNFTGRGNKNFDSQSFVDAKINILISDPAWERLIAEIVASIIYIWGNIGVPRNEWLRTLLPLANPYSATNVSVLQLEKIAYDLINILNRAGFKPEVSNSDASFTVRSTMIDKPATARNLICTHVLKPRYYNELNHLTGFDYLGAFSTGNLDRISRVSTDKYAARADKEIAKYGKYTKMDTTGINSYGFLSPRIVKTPENFIDTSTGLQLAKAYDLYQANTTALSKEKDFMGNSFKNRKNRYAEIGRILSSEAVTFKYTDTSLKDIAKECAASTMATLDSSLYFTTGSVFVFDNTYIKDETKGSSIPRYKDKYWWAQDSKLMDNKILVSILEESMASYKDVKVNNAGAIFGSPAHRLLQSANSNLQSINLFELNINFNSVMRVQFLAGFGRGLNNPQWVTLSPSVVATAKKQNSLLLCRLTDPGQVLSVENKFKLPSFDKLFIIGDADPMSLQSRSNYFQKYMELLKTTKTALTGPWLNPKGKNSALRARYTCSHDMLYVPEDAMGYSR